MSKGAAGRQWVFFVSDPAAVFSPSPTDAKAMLLRLPHGQTGSSKDGMARFMVVGDALLEVQRRTPEDPTSWFIDQSVQKDGAIYVASPVDPVFVLLPTLARFDKFRPLDQILEDSTCPHLRHLSGCNLGLNVVCDVSDRFGADMLTYRLNEKKAATWLAAKVLRMQSMFVERRTRKANLASVSSSFSIAAPAGPSPGSGAGAGAGAGSGRPKAAAGQGAGAGGGESKASHSPVTPEIKRAALIDAAQLVAEYVDKDWQAKMLAAVGLKLEDIQTARKKAGSRKVGGAETAAAAWNAEANNDIDRFRKRTGGDLEGASAPKKARTQSRATKILAKTNTKGMKSMKSFFSARPAKKKTKKASS